MENKLFTFQGVMNQTKLRQAISIVGKSEADARMKANTFAEVLYVERVEPLSEDWK